jgi:cytochrome c
MRAFGASVLLGATLVLAPSFTWAAGDAKRGEAIYSRCLACHAVEYDRTGPRHCGLIGRRAGTVPGFAYSDAMKRSGITWNAKTLDRFIADPLHVVPGTAMGYDGVKDPKERADLIAYLVSVSPSCAIPPQGR